MRTRNLLWILVLALGGADARAQSGGDFDLSWNTVDAGGGISKGDDSVVAGSIGQPEAGRSQKSAFRLTAGFWAFVMGEAETPTPTLTPLVTSTPTGTPAATATRTSTPISSMTATPEFPVPTETPSLTPRPTMTPTTTLTPTMPLTPRPTMTPTTTLTPTMPLTPRPTMTLTPTPTLTSTTIPGDINGDGRVNSSDLFHFGLDWQKSAAMADPRCNAFPDAIINEEDLLLLLDQWHR